MVLGEIELVKSIQLTGDIVLLENLKSHGAEGIIEVIAHLCDGVKAAAQRQIARYGTVKIRRHFGSFQLQFHPLVVDQFCNMVLGLVQHFSHLGTKSCIEIGELFHHHAQRTLFAHKSSLDTLQLALASCLFDLSLHF